MSASSDLTSGVDPSAPVRTTIHRVFKILARIPCEPGMAALWAEARDLRDEVDGWRRSPPTPGDQADVLRRALSTHANVTALADVHRRL